MTNRIYLGELEELVLLMVALLGDDAYGVSITEQLKAQANRKITISATHSVLHRLEEKGFVKSKMGGASTERGGRRKRMFRITAYGRNTLEDLRTTRNSIWAMMSKPAMS
ncbi:MAG: helix-turn-helix transcriptional regulator [Bacteroidota bacterium]